MRTKNIQQFRTLWRNQEGYKMSDWDENYIGSVHDGKLFGFYRMVNGIVDNIKADLTPKLQNAQDEQAIYEFLQNAADSQSTECAVIYDENFFMVLNNGKPFTDKDLKALLNSFQGTKSDKSKAENCGKIGRYGIGFKLAYRLMGKSDGADELLNQLAGPLLYSWHNSKQFKELFDYKGAAVNTLDNKIDGNDSAWLLKIILACFPVGLGEKVKDLDYQNKELFSQEELSDLVGFMNKHRDKLEKLTMPQGSLFFLKFGPKKHEKLKESLLNIQSGIGYSMNTLKTLEKVVLQDTIVEKYGIDFEKFSVQPGTEDFMRIDPEFPSCPIDIALGFPKDFEQMKQLKRSPNIYQFFPMRNERHNMAYFIHATSFAKITDRTRLDDQGEANIESFRFIAKTLKKNLAKYKQENFSKFALIYKALILSDKSDEYDADLINNHLYNPMLEFVRSAIPTHKKNFYLKDLVVVKDTRLNIDPMSLGIGKEWFFWTDLDKDRDIMNEAVNNAKLGLRRWGLKELILEAGSQLVDNLLEHLSASEYAVFVSELKTIEFDSAFLEKFQYVKCFRFSDNKGNLQYFSIKDLQSQTNVFLMSERLMPYKEEIKAMGFGVLEFNIQDYAVILKHLEKQLDYLSSDRSLFLKISERTVSANLSAKQKHRLFEFMSKLNGIRADELRKLALFSNGYGLVVPLQSLLSPTAKVEPWLEDFKINKAEDADVLHPYYAQADSWELYEFIISPQWNNLVKHSTLKDDETIKAFYERVLQYYRLKPGMSKPVDSKTVYVDAATGFTEPKAVFYYKTLSEATDYNSLRSAFQKAAGLLLPHPISLEYFAMDPFRIMATTVSKEWKTTLSDLLKNAKELIFSAAEKTSFFGLLKSVLTPIELQKLELFENNKGEKTVLSNLIPSTLEVEHWLKPYQIKKSEDSEILISFLSSESDIFNNIIVEKWEYIISDTETIKNISAFYNSVEKYCLLSKAPKPIINGRYVYVDKEVGFVSSAQLCYHTAMQEMDNYKDLRKAIKTISDYYTAAPEVLPFLNNKPFKSRETGVAKIVKNEAILSREEVIALMQFMDKIKEDFFKVLTVVDSENAREFLVEKRTRATPYYLEKSQLKLADKIADSFGDSYKLLPLKLYIPDLRNEGLLMHTSLFNVLSKAKDVSPELLSAMIVESESADLQDLVIGKIDKIVLRQDLIYTKDSFEHQALQIFRNKEADHSKVREKIIIEASDGQQYKLTEIGFDSQLIFSIERDGKYSLQLSEILPEFQKYQLLLESVMEKMVDYEALILLRKRCFEAVEMPVKRVLLELKKAGNELHNAAQLAFVMLLAKTEDNSKLSREFFVKNKSAEWVLLSQFDCFHLKSFSFIDAASVIDTVLYKGIEVLLKLNDGKRYYFEFGNQKLAIEPYLEKNTFYCSPLCIMPEGENAEKIQKELLDFCYKKWSSDDQLALNLQLYSGNSELFNGINFNAMVFPDNYALLGEQVPEWLKNWIGKDSSSINFDDNADVNVVVEEDEKFVEELAGKDKLSFLVALGLNAHRSPLVRLRRYLQNKLGRVATQKQLNDIHNNGKQHLHNSILWMQSEGTKFNSEDDRIHWLRKLYNSLDQLTAITPLPYISEVIGKEEEHFVYKLDINPEKELYYFDAKQQQLLRDKYEVSMSHVLNVMKQSAKKITNIAIKNLELSTSPVEELLDIDHLKAETKEWAASHYLKWREEVPYRVYIYDGKIPYILRFLGQTVKILRQGNAVVHDRIAYANNHSGNLEEALFEVSSRNALSELMLLQLLRYKNEAEAPVSKQPVIEKIIEKVLVQEIVSENEEIIENPRLDKIKDLKNVNAKGLLKMTFEINELTDEMLEQLMKLSKSTRIVVTKNELKK